MAFTRITDNDTINKGVIGLPDTPNLSTSEMQAKFEELSNDVIIPKFNNLVDELEAKSAAGNIGATIPSGINAESENVQAVLNGIAEKAHTHAKTDEEITGAVELAHEHSNKNVIDKFTENDSGVPLYDGNKMSGDAFKTVKVGTTSIVATDYDTIEIIAGDNVVIDADEVNKTLKFSAVGGSGSGGGDMYKAVYDKNNDGMVDDAKTVGSLDLLNTTNKTNAVTAINEVLQDHTEFVDHGSLYSTNTEVFKDLESGFYRLRNYKSDLFPGSVAVTGTMQKNVVGGHHTGTIITTDGVNYTRFADYDSSGTLVSDTGWKKMSVDTLTTMEQVEASTDLSKPVGAGAVQELNSSLSGVNFITEEGKGITGYTLKGADTVFPFSSNSFELQEVVLSSNNEAKTATFDIEPNIAFVINKTGGFLYPYSYIAIRAISSSGYEFNCSKNTDVIQITDISGNGVTIQTHNQPNTYIVGACQVK